MRSSAAKARALAGNDLRRTLKALRDGAGDPIALANRCVSLANAVAPSTAARIARELKVTPWLADAQIGDAAALARRSSAFIEGPPTPMEARSVTPVAPEPPADERNRAEPVAIDTVGDRGAGRPRRLAREFRTLTAADVQAIHAALVENFAASPDPIDPPGVKSESLLESAVGRQFTSLGGEPKYKTLAHMAASLFYGIALNHPFHNGNKRTALVALICLADLNDLAVTASEKELFDFVLAAVNHEYRPRASLAPSVATDQEVEGIAGWITQRLRKKGHVERMVRWRELRSRLRTLGVESDPTGGSQLELVRDPDRTVVDFDGDTREVNPGVVRKIRRDLHLTPRDGCDDDVFFGDSLPLDHFIAKYRGLLRELAHV